MQTASVRIATGANGLAAMPTAAEAVSVVFAVAVAAAVSAVASELDAARHIELLQRMLSTGQIAPDGTLGTFI